MRIALLVCALIFLGSQMGVHATWRSQGQSQGQNQRVTFYDGDKVVGEAEVGVDHQPAVWFPFPLQTNRGLVLGYQGGRTGVIVYYEDGDSKSGRRIRTELNIEQTPKDVKPIPTPTVSPGPMPAKWKLEDSFPGWKDLE